MSVWIDESAVRFGPFEEGDIFQIEQSPAVAKLGESIKKTEFILLMAAADGGRKLVILEAKSTIPRESDAFFQDVRSKMLHTLTVWLLATMGKHAEIAAELPIALNDPTLVHQHINLVLVIPTIPDQNLSVITDKFRKVMMGDLRAWGIDLNNARVLNQSRATAFGLITA